MNLSVNDASEDRTKPTNVFPSQSVACLESISETASEKPLSLSLYRFVIKTDSSGKWGAKGKNLFPKRSKHALEGHCLPRARAQQAIAD